WHLHDEPVQACPPSAWYRWRKFARRHRAGLALAACAAVTVLIAGAAALRTYQLQSAQAAERAKRREDTEHKVEVALAEAAAFRGQARLLGKDPGRAQAALAAALSAVKRGQGFVGDGEIDDGLRHRLAGLAGQLAEE